MNLALNLKFDKIDLNDVYDAYTISYEDKDIINKIIRI